MAEIEPIHVRGAIAATHRIDATAIKRGAAAVSATWK